MTIPTSKASTANVDQGSDKTSLARPDIKQNIDNVNEIIDHLNAAPSFLPAYISYGNQLTTTQGSTLAHVEESPRLITAGNTSISIVAGDSAGGPSKISIPAGSYLFENNTSTEKGASTGQGGAFINAFSLQDETNGGDFFVNDAITIESSSAANTAQKIFYARTGIAVFSTTVQVGLYAVGGQVSTNHSHAWARNSSHIQDSASDININSNTGFLLKITKLA